MIKIKTSKSGMFAKKEKPLINNVNFPSMFPKAKPIVPRKNMKQKEFLKKTKGLNIKQRFGILDGGKVIGGIDCRPFNILKHDDGEFSEEYEEQESEESVEEPEKVEVYETEYVSEANKDMDYNEVREIKPKEPARKTYFLGKDETKRIREKIKLQDTAKKAEYEGIPKKTIAGIENSERLSTKEQRKKIEKEIRKLKESEREKQKVRRFSSLKRRGELTKLHYDIEKRKSKIRQQPQRQIGIVNYLGQGLSYGRISNTVEDVGASEGKLTGFMFNKPVNKKGTKFNFKDLL